jgi:hypothetical protein
MAVRISAFRAGRSLHLGRFVVLISVTGWVDPRVSVRLEGLGRLGKLNKSDDLIGNTTRDLPALSNCPKLQQYFRHSHILKESCNNKIGKLARKIELKLKFKKIMKTIYLYIQDPITIIYLTAP